MSSVSSESDSFDNSNSTSSNGGWDGGRNNQRRYRRSSHPDPKLPIFSGDSTEWDTFLHRFNGVAKRYHWGSRQKLQRLKEFLRDKATYVLNHSRKDRADYQRLMECLKSRVKKEDPSVV